MTNKSHDDNDYLLGERGVIIRPPRSRDIPSLAWKKENITVSTQLVETATERGPHCSVAEHSLLEGEEVGERQQQINYLLTNLILVCSVQIQTYNRDRDIGSHDSHVTALWWSCDLLQ